MEHCEYCDGEAGHDSMCPVPWVEVQGGGVASSHWAEALLNALDQYPKEKHVEVVTHAFMALHRFAAEQGRRKGYDEQAQAAQQTVPPETRAKTP